MPTTTTMNRWPESSTAVSGRVAAHMRVTVEAETFSAIDAAVAAEVHKVSLGNGDNSISVQMDVLTPDGTDVHVRASVDLLRSAQPNPHAERIRALAMVGDMPTPGPDDWKKSVGILGDDDRVEAIYQAGRRFRRSHRSA